MYNENTITRLTTLHDKLDDFKKSLMNYIEKKLQSHMLTFQAQQRPVDKSRVKKEGRLRNRTRKMDRITLGPVAKFRCTA